MESADSTETSSRKILRFSLGACFTAKCYEVLEALLQRGADPNAADNNGFTPLMAASANGQAQAVSVLLSRGAHVDVKDKQHLTALAFAVLHHGNSKVMQLLIKHGANVNLRYKGMSLVQIAGEDGKHEAVDILLKAGAKK